MRSLTLAGIACLALTAAPASGGVADIFQWNQTAAFGTPPAMQLIGDTWKKATEAKEDLLNNWPALPTPDDCLDPPSIVEEKQRIAEKYASLLSPPDDWPTHPSIDDLKAKVDEIKQKVSETCPDLPAPDDWPTYPSLDDWKSKLDEIKQELADKVSNLPTPGDWPTYPSFDQWKAKLDEIKQKAEEKYSNLPTSDDWPDPPSLDDLPNCPDIDEVKAKLEEVKQALSQKFADLPTVDPPACPTSDELKAKLEEWKESVETRQQEIAAKRDELVQKYEDWAQSVAETVQESTAMEFCDGLYDWTDGQFAGNSSYLMTGGKLMGTGVVDGLFQQWGGIFAPGHSPGKMEFTNGYILGAGELQIEIQSGGGEPGVDLDFFDITGEAVLDSTVKLLLLENFEPEDGQTFDVMTAGSFIFGDNFVLDQSELAPWGGHFDMSVVAGGNGEILRLTAAGGWFALADSNGPNAVPEPSTLIMLLGAGICLAGYRWRRRKMARR